MTSRFSFHSQLSSIMETMARSALSQISKLVDEDTAELRLRLSQLLVANTALAEKVNSLECELTIVRSDSPTLCKSYRTFTETLSNHITETEVKDEDGEDAASSCQQEALTTEEHEESMAVEPERHSVGISVDGSTYSLPFDEDEEPAVCAGGMEEASLQLICISDTEEPFSSHIIPIEEDDEDDNVQFVEETQLEETSNAASMPSYNKELTFPANDSENSTAPDSQDDFNMHHVETARDSDKDGFSCVICGRMFFHKGVLAHHIKSHKSNYCNVCKQVFPHKQFNTHTCQPPVPSMSGTRYCEICRKTFANPSALRIHYLVHTGEKPHRCSFCGKGFTQKGNLKCHLRIHTGERPFCCVKCGKTFTQKVNLNHHLMAHRKQEVPKARRNQPVRN
ncbi:zinc finger protein Gfi-1b-like isoform X2 [Plectropomus leopardus]|uniref:zinc finger protein Gfi-1b-like isoform X2 n=1 Tax=Plectropomus leopardus TaxID=160734 RepID=UPI001C4C9783|nr:zinc finger protein Gfi-1b-like isoform X2 [Plectropomus leopardus]